MPELGLQHGLRQAEPLGRKLPHSMIVGPGRIRAILDGIWQPAGLSNQNFALVEIGEKGLTVLTEASCADGVHASSRTWARRSCSSTS